MDSQQFTCHGLGYSSCLLLTNLRETGSGRESMDVFDGL